MQPDLLVVAVDDIGDKNVSAPLALAVEVLSPSTRRTDRLLKRSRYEEGGIGAYWIVDPTVPSIEALVLVDGVYQREAYATGERDRHDRAPVPGHRPTRRPDPTLTAQPPIRRTRRVACETERLR